MPTKTPAKSVKARIPVKPAAKAKPAAKPTAKPAPTVSRKTPAAKATPAKPVPAKAKAPAAKPVPAATKAPATKPTPTTAKAPVIKPVPKSAPQASAKPVAPAAKPVLPAPKSSAPAPKPSVPAAAKPSANGSSNGAHKPFLPPPAPKPIPKVETKAAKVESTIPAEKDLSVKNKPGHTKDRIVLMVPDPFWLHCYWELSLQSVQRAEAALGQDWHGAKPIIRLFDVTSQDTTSTSETPVRDIVVHGGCSHWYIDVPQPPRTYRADIGYISKRGQFYVLARSNVVTPPKSGATESLEDSWAADLDPAKADRVLAMSTGFESTHGPAQLKELFDEQFRRPIKEGSFGTGAAPGKLKKFHFELDAELVVFGKTDPTATVTLQNEPVKLRPDGSFTMRFSLPDSRQIIPAVATSSDGLEEQTIVLAVERNIKRLDPMVHDLYSEQ